MIVPLGIVDAVDFAVEVAPIITSNGGGPTATIDTITGATAVTTVTATGTVPVVFSISGGADQALFSINASTGVLAYKIAAVTGNHVVIVTATNDFGSDSQTITSAVGVVPVITSNGGGSTADVAVASPLQAVTTVVATGTAPITYSKNGGADQALFSIDASTGVLTFASASTNGVYVVIVRAANTWGHDDQTITVTVS
jgi:hypothetical protein